MLIAIIITINAFKSKIFIFFNILFLYFFALLLENLLLAYIFIYSIILFSKSFVKNKQKKSTGKFQFFLLFKFILFIIEFSLLLCQEISIWYCSSWRDSSLSDSESKSESVKEESEFSSSLIFPFIYYFKFKIYKIIYKI